VGVEAGEAPVAHAAQVEVLVSVAGAAVEGMEADHTNLGEAIVEVSEEAGAHVATHHIESARKTFARKSRATLWSRLPTVNLEDILERIGHRPAIWQTWRYYEARHEQHQRNRLYFRDIGRPSPNQGLGPAEV
jgi:hypothetical protein